MHVPSLEPQRSSYFEYEIFPFATPPEMAGTSRLHPVVISGAGPVGLALAIDLKMRGIDVVVIEAQAQVSGGSRAVVLTQRSMEIMQRIGVSDALSKDALGWDKGWSFYKGNLVFVMDAAKGEPAPFSALSNLQQNHIEAILLDRCATLGVDVRFQTRVDSTAEEGDAQVVFCDTPQGPYRLRCAWLVAADGARSTLRKSLGLRYEGQSWEGRFLIADFRMALDKPTGRRAYFDPPWMPGGSVLLHKEPFDIWRLDYLIPEDMSDEEAVRPERVSEDIRAHLAYIGVDAPWALEWITVYKPNALTMPSYRNGRVLFCGDAAHLLPVFGVRGLNTGLQDANNLAWKLAAVASGIASPTLLDTYSQERVKDARLICDEAAKSTRFMTPPTRGYRILRDAVLGLSIDNAFTRGLLHWRTSKPIAYDDSALNSAPIGEAFAGGPQLGAVAPNVRLGGERSAGSRDKYLFDLLGRGFSLLIFCRVANDLDLQAVRHLARLDSAGPPLDIICVGAAGDSLQALEHVTTIRDDDAALRKAYGIDGANSFFLLRPDLHVCNRGPLSSLAHVEQAIATALCTATVKNPIGDEVELD